MKRSSEKMSVMLRVVNSIHGLCSSLRFQQTRNLFSKEVNKCTLGKNGRGHCYATGNEGQNMTLKSGTEEGKVSALMRAWVVGGCLMGGSVGVAIASVYMNTDDVQKSRFVFSVFDRANQVVLALVDPERAHKLVRLIFISSLNRSNVCNV